MGHRRGTPAERSKTEMLRRWKLVFPLRDYVSWHLGPRILICVLLSRVAVSIKIILRSIVLPEEIVKWMEMDVGGGIMHGEELNKTSYTIRPVPLGISPPDVSNKSLTTYGWQQALRLKQ